MELRFQNRASISKSNLDAKLDLPLQNEPLILK